MSETKTTNPLPYGGTTFTCDGFGNRVTKGSTFYFGDTYEIRGSARGIHLFANGQRIALIRSDSAAQYYHSNHLGSASVVTDQTGKTGEQIEYLPFGTYRPGYPIVTAGFPKVNYTFTDQEDDETGFYNYKARLYDPLVGRFISADSLVPEPGDLQSFNRYSYVKNNPLVYTDPSGHEEDYSGEGDWYDYIGDYGASSASSPSVSAGANVQTSVNGTNVGTTTAPTQNDPLWATYDPKTGRSYLVIYAKQQDENNESGSEENQRTGGKAENICTTQAKFSAVGPNQAVGKGALGIAPPNDSVAISPEAFGLPYNTMLERIAAQKEIKANMSSIRICAPWLSEYLTGGTTFTIGDVGDRNIRNSPTFRLDIYRFATQKDALDFGTRTGPITITGLPDNWKCPR